MLVLIRTINSSLAFEHKLFEKSFLSKQYLTAMNDSSKDPEIKSVLMIIAMEQEALPIVKHFNLEKVDHPNFIPGLPAVAWKGYVKGLLLHLVWCGR